MMLTLADSLFREDLVRLRPRFPRSGKAGLPEATTAETVKAEATECRDAFLPRAVMFHDSFGDRLKPFLSECFDRIVYLRDWGFSFNIRVIRAESPSVVIDELSEYFLYNAALNNAQLGGREAEDIPPTGKEGGGE